MGSFGLPGPANDFGTTPCPRCVWSRLSVFFYLSFSRRKFAGSAADPPLFGSPPPLSFEIPCRGTYSKGFFPASPPLFSGPPPSRQLGMTLPIFPCVYLCCPCPPIATILPPCPSFSWPPSPGRLGVFFSFFGPLWRKFIGPTFRVVHMACGKQFFSKPLIRGVGCLIWTPVVSFHVPQPLFLTLRSLQFFFFLLRLLLFLSITATFLCLTVTLRYFFPFFASCFPSPPLPFSVPWREFCHGLPSVFVLRSIPAERCDTLGAFFLPPRFGSTHFGPGLHAYCWTNSAFTSFFR